MIMNDSVLQRLTQTCSACCVLKAVLKMYEEEAAMDEDVAP